MVQIEMLDKAKEVWEVVCRRYEASGTPGVDGHSMNLWRSLENIQFQGAPTPQNVRAHVTELRRLRNLLGNMGMPVEDRTMISTAMRSLPECFSKFSLSYRIAVPTTERKDAEEFFDAVQDCAERLVTFAESQSQVGESLRSAGSGRGGRRECSNCRRFGHLAKDCWAVGGGKEGQGPWNMP